jgi:hypothetical protein
MQRYVFSIPYLNASPELEKLVLAHDENAGGGDVTDLVLHDEHGVRCLLDIDRRNSHINVRAHLQSTASHDGAMQVMKAALEKLRTVPVSEDLQLLILKKFKDAIVKAGLAENFVLTLPYNDYCVELEEKIQSNPNLRLFGKKNDIVNFCLRADERVSVILNLQRTEKGRFAGMLSLTVKMQGFEHNLDSILCVFGNALNDIQELPLRSSDIDKHLKSLKAHLKVYGITGQNNRQQSSNAGFGRGNGVH